MGESTRFPYFYSVYQTVQWLKCQSDPKQAAGLNDRFYNMRCLVMVEPQFVCLVCLHLFEKL